MVRMRQESYTCNERTILLAVQHPFIINLWGTSQDAANLYMVMDFVPGGELFTLLRKANVSRRSAPLSSKRPTMLTVNPRASQILPQNFMLAKSPSHLSTSIRKTSSTAISSPKTFYLITMVTSRSRILAWRRTARQQNGHCAARLTISRPR